MNSYRSKQLKSHTLGVNSYISKHSKSHIMFADKNTQGITSIDKYLHRTMKKQSLWQQTAINLKTMVSDKNNNSLNLKKMSQINYLNCIADQLTKVQHSENVYMVLISATLTTPWTIGMKHMSVHTVLRKVRQTHWQPARQWQRKVSQTHWQPARQWQRKVRQKCLIGLHPLYNIKQGKHQTTGFKH